MILAQNWPKTANPRDTDPLIGNKSKYTENSILKFLLVLKYTNQIFTLYKEVGNLIFNLHLGVRQLVLRQNEGLGRVFYPPHFQMLWPSPHILFDQSLKPLALKNEILWGFEFQERQDLYAKSCWRASPCSPASFSIDVL